MNPYHRDDEDDFDSPEIPEASRFPQVRFGRDQSTPLESYNSSYNNHSGDISSSGVYSPYSNGRISSGTYDSHLPQMSPAAPSHSQEYTGYDHTYDLGVAQDPFGNGQFTRANAPNIDQHALLVPPAGTPYDTSYTSGYDGELHDLHQAPDGPIQSGGSEFEEGPGQSYSPDYYEKFDEEAQEPMGSRFGQMFGQSNEYADDIGDSDFYQIPINGDEYALNTYDDGTNSGWEDEPSSPFDGNEDDDDEYDEDRKLARSKTVRLFRGNLVLDCPVSAKLLEQYPEHQPVREFTHMRYTACTCDPESFSDDDYTLRQICYSTPRRTELFVAITIYNEDDILLGRTLQGVFNNIRHLCHRNRSKTWGHEAWKKVVVCVIADGRDKLHPRAKALMASMGVYQEGFAKNMVNDKEVHAHLYEYTTMVRIASVSESEGVKLTTEKAVPVQMMFCLKEKNKKKINSHRWFFQAFGPVLCPNVCVLLDAGTRPGNHAIYHLWKSFDRDRKVGGACGEIAAMLGTGYSKLINPLVAAQNFEYKMSNILDKPSESIFGFITVLPGAFSAYRYAAVVNHPDGTGPLEKYFKGEKLDGQGGIFAANMYLAEDRILCWELVAKRGAAWKLEYVKNAKAHTDVPEGLSELILQRRRWLNGSFFAQIYSLAHMFQIWRSSHSIVRKIFLHVEFLYQTVSLVFSWFSLGNFFLIFHILSASLGDKGVGFAPGGIISIVLTWVYLACLLTIFILSFGNRPKGSRFLYGFIVIIFSGLMCYTMFACIFVAVKSIMYEICKNGGFKPLMLVKDSTFRDLIISLLATYALYVLSSLLFFDPWHLLTSFVQYILLSPVYINVFNVYAFCNTHDISWGTKGDDTIRLDLGVVRANDAGKVELELPTSAELVDKYYLEEASTLSSARPKDKKSEPSDSEKRTDYYALFRSSVVLVWVLMNIALMGVVLNIGGFQKLLPENATSGSSAPGMGNLRRRDEGSCTPILVTSTTISSWYLAVVLWAVCAMAIYRFIFSTSYLIIWLAKL